eukprot:gene4714-9357_t
MDRNSSNLTTWMSRSWILLKECIRHTVLDFFLRLETTFLSYFTLVIKLCSLLFLFFWISLATGYVVNSYFRPSVLTEKIFFDFAKEKPLARIHLLYPERQWVYSDSDNDNASSHSMAKAKKGVQRRYYFHSDIKYNFIATFLLSKSPRNAALGKVMVSLLVKDKRGGDLARSTRPVVLPYQSTAVVLLDVFLHWPLYTFGIRREAVSCRVDLMSNFVEGRGDGASASLELTLSTAAVDVEEATGIPLPEGVILGGRDGRHVCVTVQNFQQTVTADPELDYHNRHYYNGNENGNGNDLMATGLGEVPLNGNDDDGGDRDSGDEDSVYRNGDGDRIIIPNVTVRNPNQLSPLLSVGRRAPAVVTVAVIPTIQRISSGNRNRDREQQQQQQQDGNNDSRLHADIGINSEIAEVSDNDNNDTSSDNYDDSDNVVINHQQTNGKDDEDRDGDRVCTAPSPSPIYGLRRRFS